MIGKQAEMVNDFQSTPIGLITKKNLFIKGKVRKSDFVFLRKDYRVFLYLIKYRSSDSSNQVITVKQTKVKKYAQSAE